MQAEQMELDAFGRLEHRVGEAVQLIHHLREEKGELEEASEGLATTIAGLKERNKQLRKELKDHREDSISRKEFEERKQHLEARMSELLQHLDELDRGERAAAKA